MDPEFMEALKVDQAKSLPYPETSFAGKTVIVTGSNTGLGLEAARHFVRCEASKVILAVRSGSKGEAAKADIEASTGITGVAEVWPLDLSSYASVKAFAKRAQGLERLDALIENASVAMETYEEAEGTEITVTVNVYSTFLQAILLMPKLKETAKKFKTQPVLDIVASGVGFTYPLEERKGESILPTVETGSKDSEAMWRYSMTKLIQILLAGELSRVFPLKDTGVIINYLSPGLCITELDRNLSPEKAAPIHQLRDLCGRTAEDGSRTLFHSAVIGPESHGQYLSECEIAAYKMPPWTVAEDDGRKTSQKLWKELQDKLNLIEPGCVENAIST